VVAIPGYNIYRKYRNTNGGGVVFIQDHIPVTFREDIVMNFVCC
jgi:hypothetical protein